MLPEEAAPATSAFKCSDGFEEVIIDDDVIVEEIRLDEDSPSEFKVLLVMSMDVNEGPNQQLITLEMSPNADQMQQVGEWQSTSNDVLFDDVIEGVIEEVQLDVDEEESPQCIEEVEVEVISDVATERDEENKTEENNIKESGNEEDVSMENMRECKEYVEMKNYNLSGFDLALSDTDDNNDDNDVGIPSQEEIQIEDSPVPRRKSTRSKSKNGVELLLIYPAPPEKGGISVNTEDYKCLGEDIYLNDVIIDFYLKYTWMKMLSLADRQRTHIFSSHFFTRLARSYTAEGDVEDMTEAEKSHAGVQRWTKNVNIFEKDFIVVPVNEHSHWFLVIICFANLVNAVGPMQSDCFISEDEAQRPCLLVFDSLGGKDKYRVANVLRSYLSVEYLTKRGEKTEFNKDTLKTVYVNVPRQTNATDCGLYVLQYIENFFKNPIKDFTLPFKDLSNWFERRLIVQKREQIAEIITDLAIEFSEDKSVNLPEVKFPQYTEVNSSDNEESWSHGSSSISLNWPKTELTVPQPNENPYEFVTTRKPSKYKLNKKLFDSTPTFYKRNSTLVNIKKSFLRLKGTSDDLSDGEYKPIDSESDTSEIFDINTKSINSFASTSKNFFVGVEIESTRAKRPVRKAVTRATQIKKKARIVKERKRNEDSVYYKKDNVESNGLIHSSSSNKFPAKGKMLGSSPWMSKHNDMSSSFTLDSGMSSKNFYGYSIKNEPTALSTLKFKKKRLEKHCDSS